MASGCSQLEGNESTTNQFSLGCLEKEFKEHVSTLFKNLAIKEEQFEKYISSEKQFITEEKSRLEDREKNLEEEFQKRTKELEEREIKMLKKFESEKNQMQQLDAFNKGQIKLDVGGHVFKTSKQTLCRHSDSMFGIMFSGRHNNTLTEDSSYFIDRDGTYFRYVLNFLRGVILEPSDLPDDRAILKELRAEADFYQLKGLLELIIEALSEEIDYTQEEITEMMSTLVRDDDGSSTGGIDNEMIHSNSYLDRQQQENEENYSSIAHFVSQNMTKSKLNFTRKKLNGISFAHTTFFHDVSFRNAFLSGASFYGCEFGVDVKIDFNFADLSNCDFRQCKGKEPIGNNFSHGGGLVSGSSSNTFLLMIQQGRITFKKAKISGALFDPQINDYLNNEE